MKLSDELIWRGFYNQTTLESAESLDEKSYVVYLGTDPSGDSLHVGHLAVYMMVRRFLDHGHKVILLVGGGTGMVGDPRDTTERDLLPLEVIEKNKAALANQVSALFGGHEFTLVDNYDWLKDVKLLDFLRDVGKHFSMSMLVDRDHVKKRIGEGGAGMSYAEFSYTLLQGYDYLHLYKNYGVDMQIGGSDQWGNILSGVELIRKKEGVEVDGMTAPLVIDKTTGRKFGKSEAGNAIWLDPKKTSPYQFYQFWLNVDDDGAIDYLKLFTLLSREQIDDITKHHSENPGARIAQKSLALEVTTIVHGERTAANVVHVTNVLFGAEDVRELDNEGLDILAQEIASSSIGTSVIDALQNAGLVKSTSEARRLIDSNAISINGEKIQQDQLVAERSLIKKGKNSFILVR